MPHKIKILTNQSKHKWTGDICNQNDGQTRHYGERYGPLGVVRFLAGGRDDVEPDERIETCGCARKYLDSDGNR